MKILGYLLFLLMLAGQAVAQTAPQIPSTILKLQSDKYPVSQGLNWNVSNGSYNAFFTVAGKSHFVRYDSSGLVRDIQEAIEYKELPAAAAKKIETSYAGYKPQTVMLFYKIYPSEYQEPFLKKVKRHYEVLVTKDHEALKLYFSSRGKLLNKPVKSMIRSI